MKSRILVIGLLSLALGAAGYLAGFSVHHGQHARQAPADLTAFEWFCREFAVSDAQRAEIWALHERYFPECEEFCVHYATTHRELALQMEGTTGKAARAELITLQKQADKRFLEFVYEVAAELDPEQGDRYLPRMKGWLEEVHSGSEPALAEPAGRSTS